MMELQTGTFETTLDDKGRIMVPARLRGGYSKTNLVITQGSRPCVWIMTPEIWETVSEKLLGSDNLSDDEYDLIQYQYILPAQIVEVDKAGRLAIPPAIRRYAKLVKNCLVLSAENHLEVWDSEFYYAYLRENQQVIREAMKKMGSLRLFKTQRK